MNKAENNYEIKLLNNFIKKINEDNNIFMSSYEKNVLMKAIREYKRFCLTDQTEYYEKERILIKGNKTYRITILEDKFLRCFKSTEVRGWESICYEVYNKFDNNTLRTLYRLKSLLTKKTGLKFTTKRDMGITLVTKIKYFN